MDAEPGNVFTWGREARVRADAPADARPGTPCAVVGFTRANDPATAGRYRVPLGTVMCLIEYPDGRSAEVSESWLEPNADGPRLHRDPAHFQACHNRWVTGGVRYKGASEYPDQWYREQCGGCRYFVRLTGAFFEDWGACTNSASPADRRVVFEHDGCDAFSRTDEDWDYDDEPAGS